MTAVHESTQLDIRPLSGWTGAEIHGVDLTRELSPEQVAGIRQALLRWKVVFPETAERVLYVNPGFTSHLVDLQPRESRHLLDLLFEQVARPEYTVRFRWEPGSVAFWDNRAVLHLAPRDQYHLDDVGVLHRITLVGDVAVGTDGQPSRSVEGEYFGAA
jgi:alpha-ketoglutarate-dependent taurine dioxygenase